MKLFSSLLVISLLLGSFISNTEAASRRRDEQKVQEDLDKARQEVELYQTRLEELKIKRWQDKRNAIAAQEAFNDSWNEIKADMDRLTQVKDQKEESLLRLQNQESQKAKDVEEQQSRLKQFGLQVRDKLNELGKEWEHGFPYRSIEKLGSLSAAKKILEREDPSNPSSVARLFALSYQDFLDGETKSISRERLALKNVILPPEATLTKSAADAPVKTGAKVVAGYIVRIGQTFQAFVSTEGEEVAILGKTGRLDGQSWEWIEALPENTKKDLRASVMSAVSFQDQTAPKSTDSLSLGNSQVTVAQSELALVPMDVLLTKATGEGFTTQAQGTLLKTIEKEFDGGGWVMWPIMGLMLAGILIVLERIIVFLRKDQNAKKLSAKVQSLVNQNRFGEAIQLCKNNPGAVGRVLLGILQQSDGTRADAESKAHEIILHEAPSLEKRISTMNILAAASPLVGLLGTVTGMVRLFDVITVHGTGNPKLMAGGISEALIATKWGLGVAIPMLIAYNLLDNWSGSIIANMEKYSARLVNSLFVTSKPVEEHV